MKKQSPPSLSNPEIRLPAASASRATRLADLLPQLSETQWLPADQLRVLQQRALDDILRHAWRTVPFYRDWLAAAGYAPDASITRAQFEALPVLTRQAVQTAGEQLCSQNLSPEHGATYKVQTSGSTGSAVKLRGTGITHLFWLAATLRDHQWHQRDLRGRMAVIRWFDGDKFMDANAPPSGNWGPPAALLFETGPSAALNIRHSTATQAEWLARFDPDYLLTHPSQAAALAEYFIKNGLRLNRLREVRTIGESLTGQVRELCTTAWDATVSDVYSCEEAGYVALQCGDHHNYHIQSENVLLEIVDEAGQPCAPGQPGWVLITTLRNYATPLIRYELGDHAELGEPCPCGRGLPVIRRILGRSRNRLIMPDGESCFPYLGDREEYRAITTAIRKFQFVQRSVEEIELKLVLSEPLDESQERKKGSVTTDNHMH